MLRTYLAEFIGRFWLVPGARTRAPVGFAGLAIGLALALVHLISIPVTNTLVNPARSTGPALFAGAWALQQLWLFWLAPLVGGALTFSLGAAAASGSARSARCFSRAASARRLPASRP